MTVERKDGATGGRCKLHETFDPRCPICTMPAPLPVAEFECWTCAHCPGHQVPGYKSAAAMDTLTHGHLSRCYAPVPKRLTSDTCLTPSHDIRPAGGK